MKLGIHGSYYGRNFGDTLIIKIIVDWVREYNPEIEITLPFIDSEKEAIEILGHTNKIIPFEELDGVIFCPGGYFGEPPGNFFQKVKWSIRNHKRHIQWNSLMYKKNIPFAIIGLGVGPLSVGFMKNNVIKLFSNTNYITVRDKYSKQFLKDWGIDEKQINQTTDVALTLQPKTDIVEEKNSVALHFPATIWKDEDQINEFVNFIKNIKDKYNISYFEDINGQFSKTKNEKNIRNILKKYNIDFPIVVYENPSQLIASLQKFEKIITSKLHIGIVGYSLGKKILSIPAHTKTIRFYEQIERSNFCIPFYEISSTRLTKSFEELDTIDNSTNILMNSSLVNKDVLYSFLKSID